MMMVLAEGTSSPDSDDRGAEEDVHLPEIELHHDPLQRLFF